MPVNLPIEAQKAQMEYESATNPAERLKKAEQFLRTIPKHKGTANLRAQLKQSMAKLRDGIEKSKQKQAKRKSIHRKKHGAAQICVVGFPNSGKSFLMNRLCNISLESTDVPFETKNPEVAMADYEDIQFQLIEIPSITPNFRHRPGGAELLNIIRTCDLILILPGKEKRDYELQIIRGEMESNSILLDRKKKDIRIYRMNSGGLNILGKENFRGDIIELKKVLQRYGIHNAEIILNESLDVEDLVDALDDGIVYKRSLVIPDMSNLKGLLKVIWDKLGLIRIYTKEPGKKAESEPIILASGSTIEDVGKEIHKDFVKNFRFARVFGRSAKFGGQMIGLGHMVFDRDVVEFHLR